MNRGISYENLVQYLAQKEIRNVIGMPDTGITIVEELRKLGKCNTYSVTNLEEAVNIAKEITKLDCICLLSPAAASYGFFKNFQERGDYFKTLVRK